ncbi:SRPBCC family protein [Terrabacter sp. MAHUQ-38]|uniref:SRPBCC family protein n=1 Tax=unclassified Terrabacter TaxID=2630222 RepID=UPI00165DCDE6|nr:SRPBCC family protein [Terrabacter sp. MAHUQ-38]MBC9821442.1 SRPBCC family protein [Terrabacter sp. MAHUQ-38]
MGILRGLFPERAGRRDVPGPVVVPRDVGHRVFVERTPDVVWPHLVSPGPGSELGVDCVRVLALPSSSPDRLPEFAGIWRRSNGRLWVGLSSVVDVEPGVRVVCTSSDGAVGLTLTTTLESLDGGCVVAQRLDGVIPTDPVAEFARAWMARALLGLKADVEGTPRERTRDVVADAPVDRTTASGFVGHGAAVAGTPGVTSVHETATIDVAVTPDRLWEVLAAPSSEQLLKPSVERLVRLELADEPGREHVLAVHRHDDGRRGGSVSLVVESTAPARLVERDVTASHETDVVTTVEATDVGSRLTETFTGWLPSGPGRVVDSSGIAALMRTRLAVVKNLAEAGVGPQRDARTDFRPPGEAERDAVRAPVPGRPGEAMPTRPSVPSSVLLPPPHVAAPAAGYEVGGWFAWGGDAFWLPTDIEWW